MRYYKIDVSLREYPERLNRTLLVSEEMNLFELGWVIGTSLSATFEHKFGFDFGDYSFVSKDMCEQASEESMYYDYEKTNLLDFPFVKDLRLLYTYDYGDSYEFMITVLDSDVEHEGDDFAICLDGKGWGIFEDNHYTLDAYFEGKITDFNEEEYFRPYNYHENLRLIDYDNVVDLDYINENIDVNYSIILKMDLDFRDIDFIKNNNKLRILN